MAHSLGHATPKILVIAFLNGVDRAARSPLPIALPPRAWYIYNRGKDIQASEGILGFDR
jgi:hypothetical protein